MQFTSTNMTNLGIKNEFLLKTVIHANLPRFEYSAKNICFLSVDDRASSIDISCFFEAEVCICIDVSVEVYYEWIEFIIASTMLKN